MNIQKHDLLEAVEFSGHVTKGSPKGNCPSSSQLRLTAEEGGLLVEATDGTQFGWRRTKVTGSGLPPVCVSASHLLTILELCQDKISLELIDGKLFIKSGGEHKLNTTSAKEFPNAPVDDQKETNWPAKEFADALKRVSFASSDSPAVMEKWGVHVHAADKLLVCDAYSGIQYARVETAVKKPTPGAFFVPLGFLPNLARELREKDAKFSFFEKTVKVIHASGGYVCTLANVKALSVDAYLQHKRESIGKIKASGWLPFFKAVRQLGGQDAKLSCKVTIDGKYFYHTGPSGENVVPVPDKLKTCNLNLNAVTFSNILEALESGDVDLSVSEEAKAVFLQRGGFLACTSQLRE